MRRVSIAAALLFAAWPALANDSTAELGTGGLILSRTDAIRMAKEVLFISERKVTVDYVFHNVTDADVSTIVAFPMPDIEGNPFSVPAIPNDPDDNFLGFKVTVEGQPVEPKLEQKAFALGIDVSGDLQEHQVPFYPYGEATAAALAKLPDAVARDWIERGMLVIEEYDDGSGWKQVRAPFWQLKSTFWWRTTFPANADVHVSHEYAPSVGGSAGLTFFSEGRVEGPGYEDYKAKYCLDSNFSRAVLRAAKEGPDGYPPLNETRISYILTTGGNWATGSIGDFTLTIDKGDPEALVSFCGHKVKKTGPTTFQMKAKDFYPERDVDVLILKPTNWDRGASDAVAPARKTVRKPTPGASPSGG